MNAKILLPVLIASLVTMGALVVGGDVGGGVSVERQDSRQSDSRQSNGVWQVAGWNSRPGCVIWYAADGADGYGSAGNRSSDSLDFHQRGCVNLR